VALKQFKVFIEKYWVSRGNFSLGMSYRIEFSLAEEEETVPVGWMRLQPLFRFITKQ
jgi:hypothetical protein